MSGLSSAPWAAAVYLSNATIESQLRGSSSLIWPTCTGSRPEPCDGRLKKQLLRKNLNSDTQAASCVAKTLVDLPQIAGLTAAEGLGRRP